jgi:tRNA pseudouridine38-40 synthase
MTRRIALLLEYDGSRFAGSQLQANAVTVQSVLEEAIEKATEQRTRVAFAGRTDAGTHARGQVASFVTDSRLDADILVRALNAWLPADVVVRDAADVAPDFDPRRDAISRHYRYVIDNSATRPALDRERAWHVATPLDEQAMSRAARELLGSHDFAAFASPVEEEGVSTVRDLKRFDVTRRGSQLHCDVVANAFLRHQVRRMVGALAEVGKGKLSVDDYVALLSAPPASVGPTAPAHALYLMRVEYDPPVFTVGLDSAARVC